MQLSGCEVVIVSYQGLVLVVLKIADDIYKACTMRNCECIPRNASQNYKKFKINKNCYLGSRTMKYDNIYV